MQVKELMVGLAEEWNQLYFAEIIINDKVIKFQKNLWK